MMHAKDNLTIGEVARRTGVSVSAIRFYEERGLIEARRNAGGQRRFLRADIRRLSFIRIAQQFGFTVNEIAGYLQSLPLGRAPTKRDWEKVSRVFRKEIDRKIALLEKTRNLLDGCIGCGCLSMKNCALFNARDELAARGSGPQLILPGNEH